MRRDWGKTWLRHAQEEKQTVDSSVFFEVDGCVTCVTPELIKYIFNDLPTALIRLKTHSTS